MANAIRFLACALPNFGTFSMAFGAAALSISNDGRPINPAVPYVLGALFGAGTGYLAMKARNARIWIASSWLLLIFAFVAFESFISKMHG